MATGIAAEDRGCAVVRELAQRALHATLRTRGPTTAFDSNFAAVTDADLRSVYR